MYLTWVIATAAGAALGPTLGDVEAYGFEMAFPAVFLVMLKGMWERRPCRPSVAHSLALAGVMHLLLPGAWYVAAGAASGLVSAYAWEGRVLISVIAPAFVSDRPADLAALAITVFAATRVSLLPTVVIGVAAAGLFRHFAA